MIDEGRPLFLQIAEEVEDSVVGGSLVDGDRAPSTNELAAFYRINPATAAKGINVLVDRGILVKRRGIGMFVADGARARLRDERRTVFADRYIQPLLAEARTLGLTPDDLARLVRERAADEQTDHRPEGTDR
ncbi:GntR family transcriptional regulator [Microbacterium oleivorans]|uniref:GntR family transcriptional regulator n=1 Tax=Microbacterium oleivorans TaxID=273677 RepID=A0A7D5JDF4_9MICO|nr:GntR family transcriptional regulator [Microbacterium oleivorans]QLD11820.1 GntR family transcriptional regulator [Microbacterium oleivorans]